MFSKCHNLSKASKTTPQSTVRYCLGKGEARSIYVLCGQWMHCLGRCLPISLALAALVLGLVVDRNGWAIVAGLVCSSIMSVMACLKEPEEPDQNRCAPRPPRWVSWFSGVCFPDFFLFGERERWVRAVLGCFGSRTRWQMGDGEVSIPPWSAILGVFWHQLAC